MFERFSKHAFERASQRNIRGENIEFLLRFGRKIHRAGALFVFLGRHDIPSEYLRDDRYAKLEGTTLVVSNDGECLITAYRNKKALRQIKKKLKRYVACRNFMTEPFENRAIAA